MGDYKLIKLTFALLLLTSPVLASPCQDTLSGIEALNASSFTTDSNIKSQWFLTSQKQRKGIALSIHGLNLHPYKMSDLVQYLNQIGYDVLNAALYGHRGNIEEMKSANYLAFEEHARLHLCEVIRSANRDPIVFLGYSMGAVLQGNLLYQFSELDNYPLQVIWLAPAFQLRWVTQFINFLSGSFILPGFGPPSYQANYGVSLNAYSALQEGRQKFKQNFLNAPQILPPTLIVLNPKDEVIHFQRSREFFSKTPQVQLALIESHNPELTKSLHHLIIDEDSLGENWVHLTSSIETFLKGQ